MYTRNVCACIHLHSIFRYEKPIAETMVYGYIIYSEFDTSNKIKKIIRSTYNDKRIHKMFYPIYELSSVYSYYYCIQDEGWARCLSIKYLYHIQKNTDIIWRNLISRIWIILPKQLYLNGSRMGNLLLHRITQIYLASVLYGEHSQAMEMCNCLRMMLHSAIPNGLLLMYIWIV